MSHHVDPTESLPAGVAGRINPVCDRFEAAWQSGGRPRLEEFLPQAEAEDQPWLLRELLRLEVFYRGRSGETPTAEEYRRRLPDHAALIEEAFAALPTADPHATRYSDTPAVADPHATRYSDTPAVADPYATRYSDPPAAEAPSSRLPRRFGGYELLEEIGHGGMGVVYKARQFSPERLVALKVIRAGQLADEEDVRRFRQEADEAARLDHPNIVPVYEVGEQDGLHFFTMKLVEGGGLDKHLERYRTDPKAAARLLATAARAVHHAHQRQLLHRDLKPGNILLDAAGQPHVADFGLAKRMEGDVAAMTRSNAIVGTPEYMAPEQAGGEKRLTTAVDVYALGGVLYALLTGRAPFQAKTPLDVLVKVVSAAPAPPSKVRPGAPRDLETICLKCLAKEPAKRYGSAEALAEDLERWLKGEPVRARRVGVGERAVKWMRRRPAVAGLLALLVTVVVGAFVLLLGAWGTAQQNFETADRNGKDLEKKKVELQGALYKEHDAVNAMQDALDGQKRQLSVSARFAAGLGDAEYRAGNLRDSLNWMLRAYTLAPKEDSLRRSYLCRIGARGRGLSHFSLWHDGPVNAASFSPDGRMVVTASDDNTARLWNAACVKEVLPGRPPAEPWRLGGLLWDAASGKELRRLTHDGPVKAASFSPDGRMVVTVSGFTAWLWDATTGKQLQQLTPDRGFDVVAALFSPDSRTVLTIPTFGPARLWNAANGNLLYSLEPGGEVFAASFSPDGHTIVTAGVGNEAQLWDAATGKELKWFTHKGDYRVVAASLSPDGRTVVTASDDDTARLWDAATGEELHRLKHDKVPGSFRLGDVNAASFSPDGHTVVTASDDKTARLWDVATGRELQRLKHDAKVRAASFSPDGRMVVTTSTDHTARLWDAATGEELQRLKHDPGGELSSEEPAASFSPDGRTVVTASADKTARLWDAASGKELQRLTDEFRGALPKERTPSFSPDVFLSDARWDKTARMWDVNDLSAPDDINLDRLRAWVLVRTGQDFTEDGTLRPLSKEEWEKQRQTLEAHHGDWQPPPNLHSWHFDEAADAEADEAWFAARFHLDRLLLTDPNNADLLRRRDAAAAHLTPP